MKTLVRSRANLGGVMVDMLQRVEPSKTNVVFASFEAWDAIIQSELRPRKFSPVSETADLPKLRLGSLGVFFFVLRGQRKMEDPMKNPEMRTQSIKTPSKKKKMCQFLWEITRLFGCWQSTKYNHDLPKISPPFFPPNSLHPSPKLGVFFFQTYSIDTRSTGR